MHVHTTCRASSLLTRSCWGSLEEEEEEAVEEDEGEWEKESGTSAVIRNLIKGRRE